MIANIAFVSAPATSTTTISAFASATATDMIAIVALASALATSMIANVAPASAPARFVIGAEDGSVILGLTPHRRPLGKEKWCVA
eukprot:2857583-Pyramimonas_sp.AAC.1